jgi:uncharacterized protein YjbI with pentapeptide repeats
VEVRHKDVVREAHKQYSETLNKTMLTLLGVALFCLLTTLGSPDKLLLAADSTIKVPFADTPLSFLGFIVVAPALLLALVIYLHVFYGYWLECERERQYINQRLISPIESTPTLFSFPDTVSRCLTGGIFYWLIPVVLGVITWKAWVFPAMGLSLTYIAGFVTVILALLQIRNRPNHQHIWWPLMGYTICALIIGLMVRATFTPQSFQRPLNLFRVELPKAWLVGINMRHVNAGFANLQDANLTEANLMEAKLQGAKLQGVQLEGAELQGANLRGANLQGANLQGANLQGADLQGADLQRANPRGAKLQGADLRGANLQGANFQGAFLQEAKLQGADLQRANLQWANLQGAFLQGADLQDVYVPPGVVVERVNARRIIIPSESQEVIITRNVLGANPQGANLQGANLQGANLQGANLQGANLQEASLRGANLRGANLQWANLQWANLYWASLTEAKNLTQDQINTACTDENTKLPEGLTRPAPCPTHP